jgi:Putative transposase/Transposase zinc-binding domain
MSTLTEVVRRHGAEYLERHGRSVLPSHVRAIANISRCRTAALGGHLAECDSCHKEHLLYHSCRHRACPQCGYIRTTRWLERQSELLLPVPYFHVVFTLPSELRRVVRSNQKLLLPVLFRAAYESLSALCQDPHFLGAQIGALAVLHTWTRTLEWHPHVHLLVPGGGLAADGKTWVPAPKRGKRYLVPRAALSEKFRGRFMALARQALPKGQMPSVPNKRWVTFAKPVVQGAEQVLEYLGRYVHKTAIGNQAVLTFDERTVTFRYTDSQSHERKQMTLAAHEFLRRFLQHVPPRGFHRVRCFGLLQSRHRETLRRIQLMLAQRQPVAEATPRKPADIESQRCPHCGKRTLMKRRRLTAAECNVLAAAWELPLKQRALREARAPPAQRSGSVAQRAA